MSISGPADGVATRVIRAVGKDHAKRIALAILEQLG
jgi:hypothetical protein